MRTTVEIRSGVAGSPPSAAQVYSVLNTVIGALCRVDRIDIRTGPTQWAGRRDADRPTEEEGRSYFVTASRASATPWP
ncbi:hypothetical protein GCM10009540_82010 [Streptomyces turgidiscabies]